MIKADLKSLNGDVAAFSDVIKADRCEKVLLYRFSVLRSENGYPFGVYPWRNYCDKSL